MRRAAIVISVLAISIVTLRAQAREFLLYDKGIATARLEFEAPFEGSYLRSERDRATAAWTSKETLPEQSLGDGVHALPGSLALLGVLGPQLAKAAWSSRDVIDVSNGTQRLSFKRGEMIRKSTGGHSWISVSRWYQVGGGSLRSGYPPLDLLIGEDGKIRAAVDPSDDDVLVEHGWESITPTLDAWLAPGISPARFGVRQLPRAMVAMSDGVRLATDIYLPAGDGGGSRYPVILTRTPYDARAAMHSTWPTWQYVARGYALVVQDVRGRYGSEGEYLLDIHELQDGDETLTWIAAQPWCDGKIGMMGASYPGHTQWMAAYHGNPALFAIVPQSSMGTPHNDMPYTGGTLDVGFAKWTLSMEGVPNTEQIDWAPLVRMRPFAAIGEKVLGRESRLWDQVVDHQLYDDYWKAADWLRYGENIRVPALNIDGWYDDDLPGVLANWAMMAKNRRSNQKLILGAWRHRLNQDRELNEMKFGANVVRPDLELLKEQWYDHFLKGMPNKIERRAPVEYYSVGDNKWRTAAQWPPEDAQVQSWYLHSAGQAARMKTGRLSTTKPGLENYDSYDYDPADPTPSLVDVSLNEQSLPDDYSSVENRSDVAVYQTDRLTRGVRIAGPIEAHIFADSSARDTDWIVRLSDVDTAGRVNRLVEGVIRARHRESLSREDFLIPGTVVRYDIKMRAHANTFLPGHRIRIAVASAAAGYIYPNSNTGENEAFATTTRVAHQKIYHDRAHPSRVDLPVTPLN